MAASKYQEWLTEEGLTKLEGWARDGLTDEQIANNMGIAPKTLYRWKEQYSPICQTLKRGKEVIDIQVENALLKRALGYTYEEITYERTEVMGITQSGDVKLEPGIKVKTVVKHLAPDTTAQIFWLKNRKPKEWRDKKEVDANLTITKALEEWLDE